MELRMLNENHECSSFLYVGHGGMQDYGLYYYNFYMNGKGKNVAENPDAVPKIWDSEIYAVSQSHAEDNYHFVFLWTCFNGYERGSYVGDYPNGMPYCWTEGQIGPSTDGYASPDGSNYCFIGFHLAAPRLSHQHNGPNHLYKHWLVFFYYYAVEKSSSPYGHVYSVKLALDKASQCQGFTSFTQTRLYKTGPHYPKSNNDPAYKDTYWSGAYQHPAGWYDVWMRVYGDGNYYIPGDVYIG